MPCREYVTIHCQSQLDLKCKLIGCCGSGQPVKQTFMVVQIEAIAMNDNSDDGKPWIRSVDAVNINLTQPSSYTQMTLTGVAASQPESSSQVPALVLRCMASIQFTALTSAEVPVRVAGVLQ